MQERSCFILDQDTSVSGDVLVYASGRYTNTLSISIIQQYSGYSVRKRRDAEEHIPIGPVI
jgi:hypothetical protein